MLFILMRFFIFLSDSDPTGMYSSGLVLVPVQKLQILFLSHPWKLYCIVYKTFSNNQSIVHHFLQLFDEHLRCQHLLCKSVRAAGVSCYSVPDQLFLKADPGSTTNYSTKNKIIMEIRGQKLVWMRYFYKILLKKRFTLKIKGNSKFDQHWK